MTDDLLEILAPVRARRRILKSRRAAIEKEMREIESEQNDLATAEQVIDRFTVLPSAKGTADV